MSMSSRSVSAFLILLVAACGEEESKSGSSSGDGGFFDEVPGWDSDDDDGGPDYGYYSYDDSYYSYDDDYYDYDDDDDYYDDDDEAPTASVSWGGTSVDFVVSGGGGAWWIGMAESVGCDDCWTGEDCVYGYDADGTTLSYCHDGGDTGASLSYGGDPEGLVAGTTVFTDGSFDGTVTYYLESDVEFGGNGACFVWGADTTYYDGLGCTAL